LHHALCRLSLCLIGALAIFAVGERASALPIVGNAQTVVRDVKGKLEAELRTLVVDSDVFLDEEVSTGPNSGTRIVFKDGTNLELGENSKLRLTKLVFDPDPNKSEIAVKALVGVFRWTSGNLPSSAYHIASPVATIGIRGTSLEWVIGEDGMTTVALAKGSITVSNSRGDSVDLEPNQATTVFPIDPDGSQLPPSPPGPIPANILQTIWKMTAAINLFDAPAVSDPHAGPGATVTAGGFNDQQNQVFFNPPNSGNNPGGGFIDPPPGPPPPPPVQPFVTPLVATVITTSSQSGPSQTGSTPPVVIAPANTKTSINFGGFAAGTGTVVATVATGFSFNVVVATVQMLGDTLNAFRYSGIHVGDVIPANGGLAFLLGFVPPPGYPGSVFNADFQITDTLGDTWDWLLTGTELQIAAIPEPPVLAIFVFGLGAIAWVRRRRRAGATAEAQCVD